MHGGIVAGAGRADCTAHLQGRNGMKARLRVTSTVALLLGACGGDGTGPSDPGPSNSQAVSATPPAGAPPAQEPVATPPLARAPITEPVDPDPSPPPPGASPPAAQPAEGTYVLGRLVRGAIEAGDRVYRVAAEVATGNDSLWLLSQRQASDQGTTWTMHTIPRPEDCTKCLPNVRIYPESLVAFPLVTSPAGYLALAASIQVGQAGAQQEIRQVYSREAGAFEIRDDFKFLHNTTVAERRGGPGNADFVQLQVATYALSDAVFKLCLHQSLGAVRRLACTLHDKDTAALRGVHLIDDSTGAGPVEFRSPL